LTVSIIARLISVLRRRSIIRGVLKSRVRVVVLFFTASWLTNTALFYLSERVVNGNTGVDVATAMYWSVVTMTTVGYGDVIPSRGVGWVVAGFAAVTGIATYSLTVSVIADSLLTASMRRVLGIAPLKDKKVVVIGDSDSCRELVDELVANGLADEVGWLMSRQPKARPPVDFMVGDLGDEDTLRRAGVGRAEHVVLCIDDDSKTLHVALLARKINREASYTAVASSLATEALLKEAGVGHVISKRVLGRFAASTIFEPSVAEFLLEVTTARGVGDLVEVSVGREASGKPVRVVEEELSIGREVYRVLALVRGRDVELAPPPDRRVEEGDRLVLLKAVRRAS